MLRRQSVSLMLQDRPAPTPPSLDAISTATTTTASATTTSVAAVPKASAPSRAASDARVPSSSGSGRMSARGSSGSSLDLAAMSTLASVPALSSTKTNAASDQYDRKASPDTRQENISQASNVSPSVAVGSLSMSESLLSSQASPTTVPVLAPAPLFITEEDVESTRAALRQLHTAAAEVLGSSGAPSSKSQTVCVR